MPRAEPSLGFSSEARWEDFWPSSEDLDRLCHLASDLTGKPITGRFRNVILFRLIVLYRRALFRDQVLPNRGNLRAEAKALRRDIERLIQRFSGGPSGLSPVFLDSASQAEVKLRRPNALADLQESLRPALAMAQAMEAELGSKAANGQKLSIQMRNLSFRELARGFDQELGAPPTKYADGWFPTFLEAFCRVVATEIAGRKLRTAIPAERYRIVDHAIDGYRSEDEYSLLRDDIIMPDITGVIPEDDA